MALGFLLFLGLPSGLFPQVFLTNVMYTLCMLHVHIFVLDFVTPILCGEVYDLYDSSPSCYPLFYV